MKYDSTIENPSRQLHTSKDPVRQAERQTTAVGNRRTYLDTLYSPTTAQVWCIEVCNPLRHSVRQRRAALQPHRPRHAPASHLCDMQAASAWLAASAHEHVRVVTDTGVIKSSVCNILVCLAALEAVTTRRNAHLRCRLKIPHSHRERLKEAVATPGYLSTIFQRV